MSPLRPDMFTSMFVEGDAFMALLALQRDEQLMIVKAELPVSPAELHIQPVGPGPLGVCGACRRQDQHHQRTGSVPVRLAPPPFKDHGMSSKKQTKTDAPFSKVTIPPPPLKVLVLREVCSGSVASWAVSCEVIGGSGRRGRRRRSQAGLVGLGDGQLGPLRLLLPLLPLVGPVLQD
ncbi:hypothetical protein EYF80_036095 [Liparis tanakae]|uniref:Uncharacterized protein n=1 Tax=Liparis tanakae TaxID=230148 RepID=A0A4Z2GK66_9TELE|nr:hypothetical protein EYF80_036095 [Liparis tanakae]